MDGFWIIRGRRLSLSRPLVMGILNVTPDSFSDGGKYTSVKDAVLAALEMVADGADIIDIGGESTRPGSQVVDEETEAARVLPVVKAIREISDVPISIDTRRAALSREALEAGADIINDVSAMADPEMARVVRQTGAGIVLMHGYGDTAKAPVTDFLRDSAAMAVASGIAPETIVLDPGFGFNKNTNDNLALFDSLGELCKLGYPVLIGLSRKRFIGELTHQSEPAARTAGSVAAMLRAIWCGAAIVRVHDVRASRDAIEVAIAKARAE